MDVMTEKVTLEIQICSIRAVFPLAAIQSQTLTRVTLLQNDRIHLHHSKASGLLEDA